MVTLATQNRASRNPARLHPAQARRMVAKLPPMPHHDVALRPLGGGTVGARLAVYREPDFLAALYADCSAPDWRARLDARRPVTKSTDGRWRLSPPLHGTTVVALYETACAMPGWPALDPAKIESMGLVLRRRGAPNSAGQRPWRRWLRAGGRGLGWDAGMLLPAVQSQPDPDPARQMVLGSKAPAAMMAVADLRNASTLPAEEVFTLQAAPAPICAALGRTMLFAVLPLASSETTPALLDAFNYDQLDSTDAARLENHFTEYMQAGDPITQPRAGMRLDPAWKPLALQDDTALTRLATFLRVLVTELGIGENNPQAQAMRALLHAIALPMEIDSTGRVIETMPADEFALAAAPVLIGQERNITNLMMPLRWPSRSVAEANALRAAARRCLTERAAQFQPDTPKFDHPSWVYVVQPFIRVRHRADCPIRLCWGLPSDEFRIRPWWDSDAPPRKISLPDLGDLRDLKPNVAFDLPPFLANLLTQDPKKLSDGEGSEPAKIGLGWLCSFSLPIITLCAFIVLNIFLGLFNIFLQWMMWIKICIPIPTRKDDA